MLAAIIAIVCVLFLILGLAMEAIDLAALAAAGVLTFVIGVFTLARARREWIEREEGPRRE